MRARSSLGVLAISALLVPLSVHAAPFCPNPESVDFDLDAVGAPLLAGQVIDSELAADGITVSTVNSGGGPNIAIIFDSASPSGGDLDLGTPNADFAGPGIGAGGASTGAGPNPTALYSMLIIAENSVDANADDLVDTPDDEAGGGTITFTSTADLVPGGIQTATARSTSGSAAWSSR